MTVGNDGGDDGDDDGDDGGDDGGDGGDGDCDIRNGWSSWRVERPW